jgi:hypothetical protein
MQARAGSCALRRASRAHASKAVVPRLDRKFVADAALSAHLDASETTTLLKARLRVRAARRITGCPSCGGQRTGSSCTGACARGRRQEMPARWALVALRERGQPAEPGLPLRVKPSHTSVCEELRFSSTRALLGLSDGSNHEHCSCAGT